QLGDEFDYDVGVTLTQNADNNYLVTATASPSTESPPVDVPTITQDSIAPAAPTVTSPATAVVVNAASYAITGTAEAFSLVKVYVDVNNNGLIDQGDVVIAFQQLGDSDTFSIATTLTQDAANNFLVTSTDAAGNESVVADVPT